MIHSERVREILKASQVTRQTVTYIGQRSAITCYAGGGSTSFNGNPTDSDIKELEALGVQMIDVRTSLDKNLESKLPRLVETTKRGVSTATPVGQAVIGVVGAIAKGLGAKLYNIEPLKLSPGMFRIAGKRDLALLNMINQDDVAEAMALEEGGENKGWALPLGQTKEVAHAIKVIDDKISSEDYKESPPFDRSASMQKVYDNAKISMLTELHNIVAFTAWKAAAGNYDRDVDVHTALDQDVKAFFTEHKASLEGVYFKGGHPHLVEATEYIAEVSKEAFPGLMASPIPARPLEHQDNQLGY
jgi:hypothetical protein